MIHLDYNLVHHAIIKLQGPAGESKSIFIALIVKATFFIEVSWECDIILVLETMSVKFKIFFVVVGVQ